MIPNIQIPSAEMEIDRRQMYCHYCGNTNRRTHPMLIVVEREGRDFPRQFSATQWVNHPATKLQCPRCKRIYKRKPLKREK